MSSITLKNIHKAYGKDVIIPDLNFTIEDGSFTVLVGPSGCGKSTTLRMIAGLEKPTSGEIFIDDENVVDVDPGKRGIAMVFQNYALYPTMSVRDNIEFGLKNKKVPKEERNKLIADVSEVVGLTPYLSRKPSELSGGQRQRVALARAMVKNPKVFLMDEPLSNLDAKLRNQMRAEIIKLRERIDTTFIYVTHDQTEAMTLGDRIVIMKDGFIQQIGTPQEVFNHPHNLFVAGFIGTPQMNFFDAKLVKEGGKYVVAVGGIKVELSAEKQAALSARNVQPQDVTLGVRPEHITLSKDGISAKVDVSEMMGSAVHLHSTMADGKDVVIIVQTMDMNGHELSSFNMGSTIHFSFGGNVAHVFSKANGENLEG